MNGIFRDLELAIRCPFCGEIHYVIVSSADFALYEKGGLAQNAFPYLTPTEREQIISNICPSCQDKVFG